MNISRRKSKVSRQTRRKSKVSRQTRRKSKVSRQTRRKSQTRRSGGGDDGFVLGPSADEWSVEASEAWENEHALPEADRTAEKDRIATAAALGSVVELDKLLGEIDLEDMPVAGAVAAKSRSGGK
jgi:hypothetical protein